jgi:pyruvate formate lyase activating enzyme
MMTDALPTPVETLEMAHDIAVKEGMRFVYTGNVPGHKYENTYCPECGELLVDRTGFMISEYNIKDGKCPRCGEEIAMVR